MWLNTTLHVKFRLCMVQQCIDELLEAKCIALLLYRDKVVSYKRE